MPRAVLITVAMLAVSLLSPTKAHACSRALPAPAFDGVPADGATDVPTDIVPVFVNVLGAEMDANGVPGKFAIETLTGEPVTAITRAAGQGWFELVPSQPLQPNSSYRIRGTWKRNMQTFENKLEFKTGAGPRTGAVEPPVAKLQNLDWKGSLISSCSSGPQRTCVAVQEAAMVEYTYIDSFGQAKADWTTFVRGSFFDTPLTPALMQDTNFECVRLRTRASDGAFSAPVQLCGRDAPVFHVTTEQDPKCTSSGLVWDDGAKVETEAPRADRPRADTGAGGAAGTGLVVAGAGTAGVGDVSAEGRKPNPDPIHAGAASIETNADLASAGAAAKRVPPSADSSVRHVQACNAQPGHSASIVGLSGPLAMLCGVLLACLLKRRASRPRRRLS